MGREIRRVPLDFDWPLNKVWQGFLSPEWRKCPNPDCELGETMTGRWVHAIMYPLLMLDEDVNRRDREMHPYLQDVTYQPKGRPGPDAVEFGTALAGREASFLGHDSIDHWHAVKVLLRGCGLPEDFFICKTCQGHCIHPDDLAASEAWEPTPPPTGEGWQLWETVSEGSPISPVFPTAEGLIDYLVENGADGGWGGPWRRDAAEAFVRQGWAPSFISVGGTVYEGGRDADLIEGLTAK